MFRDSRTVIQKSPLKRACLCFYQAKSRTPFLIQQPLEQPVAALKQAEPSLRQKAVHNARHQQPLEQPVAALEQAGLLK
jgi:hypothetical protein